VNECKPLPAGGGADRFGLAVLRVHLPLNGVQAGGVFRTSTRPTLYRLILLCAGIFCISSHPKGIWQVMRARLISFRVLVLTDPPARQAWRDSSGVAQGAVASGRISNQLVAADQDPCTSDNGGCHGLVTCTADPSNAATGVLCGQCPDG